LRTGWKANRDCHTDVYGGEITEIKAYIPNALVVPLVEPEKSKTMSSNDTTEEMNAHTAAPGINSSSCKTSDETKNQRRLSSAKYWAIEIVAYFALATVAVVLAIAVATTICIEILQEKYQENAEKGENGIRRQTANPADTLRADPSQLKRNAPAAEEKLAKVCPDTI